jgi:hypothetical protein
MAMRQLYLVGFAVLIMPGSVEQLVIAFLLEPKPNPNPNPNPEPYPQP